MATSWDDFLSSPQLWTWIASQVDKSRQPAYKTVTTPEEQRINDARWNLFQNSPTRDFVNGVAVQAMQGLGGFTPNIKYGSEFMQGPPLGGYTVPKIDFSKLPNLFKQGVGNGSSAAPTPTGSAGNGASDPTTGIPNYGRPDPFANLPAAGNGGIPTSGPSNGGDPSGVYDKAVNYLQGHPSLVDNLLKGGGTALFAALGLPSLAGTVLGHLIFNAIQKHFGNDDTLPIRHNDLSPDVLTPSNLRDPNQQTPITYRDRDPSGMWNWNSGLGAGYMQPEGLGMGQPGFGYGMTYDSFYGGGDDGFSAGPGRRRNLV